MQMQFFALSLAAVAMAVPAPAPTPAPEVVEARQIGGSGGGEIGPSLFGGFTGFVGPSAVGGCIGGVIDGHGTTLCATETFRTLVQTKAPVHAFEERQIAGSLGGHIGSALGGTLSGEVSPTLEGCLGGFIGFDGKTVCLGLPFPEPTAAPTKA